VLLMCGEQDAVRPTPATVARLRGLVPQVETVVLPNVGHALIDVAPHLMPFLESAFAGERLP
jgi:pimeloyl-ACP methyl ester carboxylesterase